MTADAGFDPSGNSTKLRSANRARAWEWMRIPDGGTGISAWRLEWIKAALVLADEQLTPLPAPGMRQVVLRASLCGLGALAAGTALFMLYVLRRRAGAGQPSLPASAARLASLHGEWSSRTRHLLSALDVAEPPVEAILLLGRLNSRPEEVAALWSKARPGCVAAALPLIEPMSPRAVGAALCDLPGLLRCGLAEASQAPLTLGFREQTAIAFRVLLGAVAARWWARQAAGIPHEVIFANTGTADTTLLERAIQRTGGRTVHAVHGQATGPNFAGISDLALFRCRHDATTYETLGCYRACAVQPALEPRPRRGKTGLLLLSNLAHPMNAGFRETGIKDEMNLLNLVADVARSLGPIATPLLWKPHPVITKLPIETQTELRSTAKALGFVELGADSKIELVAASCHWVVSSPSTVTLDLLQAGVLCVILDPQGTLLDTAIQFLPIADTEGPELEKVLLSLSRFEEYSQKFGGAWNSIEPARPLDLNSAIK